MLTILTMTAALASHPVCVADPAPVDFAPWGVQDPLQRDAGTAGLFAMHAGEAECWPWASPAPGYAAQLSDDVDLSYELVLTDEIICGMRDAQDAGDPVAIEFPVTVDMTLRGSLQPGGPSSAATVDLVWRVGGWRTIHNAPRELASGVITKHLETDGGVTTTYAYPEDDPTAPAPISVGIPDSWIDTAVAGDRLLVELTGTVSGDLDHDEDGACHPSYEQISVILKPDDGSTSTHAEPDLVY